MGRVAGQVGGERRSSGRYHQTQSHDVIPSMRLPRRAFLSSGCASVVAFAQTVTSPEDVWRDFQRWDKNESRSGAAKTESWENRYTRKLTSEGVSPDEIRRRMAIITQKRS